MGCANLQNKGPRQGLPVMVAPSVSKEVIGAGGIEGAGGCTWCPAHSAGPEPRLLLPQLPPPDVSLHPLQASNKCRSLSYNLRGLQGRRLFPSVWLSHSLPVKADDCPPGSLPLSPKQGSVSGTPALSLPRSSKIFLSPWLPPEERLWNLS